jgi:hypothetical protein
MRRCVEKELVIELAALGNESWRDRLLGQKSVYLLVENWGRGLLY